MNDTPRAKYSPGQVWGYSTRDQEPLSTLTILKVWTTPAGLEAVHVAIDGVHVTDLIGQPLGDRISHAPFTAEALDRSVTELLRESGSVPDFAEEYAIWEKEEGGIFTLTVAEAITAMENAFRYGQSPPQ